jgi:hypothetical protein
VSKFIFYSQCTLTSISAEIAVFLNGLTTETIDRAIITFQEGVQSRKVLEPYFDSRNAQKLCSRIQQRFTEKSSTAISNVYEIPRFWANMAALVHSSNLSVIESYITRAYYMQGALNFHLWLIDIVQSAVESSSRHTWIDKLASDVQRAVNQSRTVDFDSAKYLPNLPSHRTYSYKPASFRYEQTEIISTTLSSILRLWLHFPSDELSLLQLSLINIVLSKSPSSVLFIDKVWEMYSTPFATVFNAWKGRASKGAVDKSLAAFQLQFQSHPFATPGSLEYCKLEYLLVLINEWMKINDLYHDSVPMVSRCQHSLSLKNLP